MAIAYLHNQALIAHRDIKPANILVSSDLQEIKLIDFGLAKQLDDLKSPQDLYTSIINASMLTPTGTRLYKAPEIRNSDIYNEKVDIWALGIIMTEMIAGKRNRNPKKMEFLLSPEGYNLLTKLLEKNPTKRYSAIETLSHMWFNEFMPDDISFFPIHKSRKRTRSVPYNFDDDKLHRRTVNFTDNSLNPSPWQRLNKINKNSINSFCGMKTNPKVYTCVDIAFGS